MSVHLVGRPCRNFNILGSTTLIDPRDGREKVVLSNFAAGATGNLILIDPQTGAGEAIPLPGDEGAWALLNLDNETLLVGTCPRAGYLHRLDLRTRAWAEPLCDPGESYIWNLCRGRDGLVYGGTYPGCVLLRYDPAAHRLDNVGRMSANPDNLYSRYVHAVGDAILVECWSAAYHLTLWDTRTQSAQPFGRPGAKIKAVTAEFVCTETAGELDFYDAATLQPISAAPEQLPAEPALPYSGSRHILPLQDGRVFAVRGQEYYILDPTADTPQSRPQSRPQLHPIPTPKPPTRIHTITVAPDGTVWGACGFGQTIFSCDPQTGDFWNSDVVCDLGGEVYGMAFARDRLFLSAYVGGDHIVYDPAQPWDQIGNRNPLTLQPVGPALIRPEARSVIGPDGAFWTGWMARYGVYGGGLSRVDVTTGVVTVWEDPIPGQSLMSLAADDRYLYFTTGGAGNGLPAKSEPFHFVVWEPAQGLIRQQTFPLGSKLGRVATAGGRVLVVVDQTIQVFNPDHMAWEATVACAAPCRTLLALSDGDALAFCDTHLWRINPRQGTSTRLGDLPGPVQTAATAPNGTIYFAHLTELYRLDLPEPI